MKNVYILFLGIILVFGGCTRNNQNDPSTFAYLNVNQTFLIANSLIVQSYDIDNDGQTDWAFTAGEGIYAGYPDFTTGHYSVYIAQPSPFCATCPIGVKILPLNYPISSNDLYDDTYSPIYGRDNTPNILGTGDFYIGFKSQNPTYTNSFYGWARLNLSSDGNTLIVKDMAMNKVNGGSINAGQR
jgi:hypothetical protein